ncbi:MAG: hypothetical protein GY711_25075 [bacterium]|nr:hypothetical protein [bacterium]
MSVARSNLAATSLGNRAYFGGGVFSGTNHDVVDIYDGATRTWSTASLSGRRHDLAAASAGGKVLFGGGMTGTSVYSNRVDIYDTQTGVWSMNELSLARARSVGGDGCR